MEGGYVCLTCDSQGGSPLIRGRLTDHNDGLSVAFGVSHPGNSSWRVPGVAAPTAVP